MKTAIFGLMLGILAVGGFITGGALMTGQAFATLEEEPTGSVNVATAANSDDDSVTQSNEASATQESKIKCEASVSDDDGVRVGNNTNTEANDCGSEETATVSQANVSEDNDYQAAIATACQSLAGLVGTDFCANVFQEEE